MSWLTKLAATTFGKLVLEFIWNKLLLFLKQKKQEQEVKANREEIIQEETAKVEKVIEEGGSREDRRKAITDGFNRVQR
jgi:hypothetical protein